MLFRSGMTAKYVSLSANGEAATGSITEATTLYVVWEFPDVTLINGEWWIHGENSGIKAAGQTGATGANGVDGANGQDGKDGIDGVDGVDGVTPTIEINADGYWVINGEVTNVKAVGVDGVNGQNGQDGKDGQNGKDGVGCSSVISIGSVAMLTLLGAAVIVRRKENN